MPGTIGCGKGAVPRVPLGAQGGSDEIFHWIFTVGSSAYGFAQQGTANTSAATSETSAVSCSRLNVNGRKPGGGLTVSVDEVTVGTFSGEAGVYQDLEPRMRPGINRVRLSFAAPGEPGPFGTEAELRCLAPGVASSRDTILRLQPTAKRLSAETDVNYVPR